MRPSDKIVRRLVVFGTIAALAVGALALPALAQNATEEGSESTSEETTDRFADRQSAFAEALADELGLPLDRVTEAITAAQERVAEQWRQERTDRLREHLDEAVADGELTQEQADAILEAMEAGVLPGGPGGPGRAFGGHGFGRHPGMGGPHLWFDTPDGSATDTSA